MAAPRVGGGAEVYLIPTILGPPKSATDEYGVQVGPFEPAAGNSDQAISVLAAGTMTTAKQLSVAGIELGQIVNPGSIYRLRRQTGERLTRRARAQRVRAARLGIHDVGTPVPRFAVGIHSPGFTGTPTWRGVRENFARTSTVPTFSTISISATGSEQYTRPATVVDCEGRLVMFVMRHAGTDAAIEVYRFDPSSGDTDWQSVTELASFATFVNESPWGGPTYTPHMSVVATLFKGDIYLASNFGWSIWVLRFNRADAFELLFKKPTLYSTIALETGPALCATDRELVLAVSSLSSLWTGAGVYALLTARSRDGRTWTEDSSVTSQANGPIAWHGITDILEVSRPNLGSHERFLSDIYAMSFATTSIGWAVGESGIVWKTSDGGATWAAHFDAKQRLLGVFALDATHAWAVGENGTILRTTTAAPSGWKLLYSNDTTIGTSGQWNGGTRQLLNGVAKNINDVVFMDANTGWMVCDQGQVWRTTDGGLTWAIIRNIGSDAHYNGVALRITPGTPILYGLVICGAPDRSNAGKRIVTTADAETATPTWAVDDLATPGPEVLYGRTRAVTVIATVEQIGDFSTNGALCGERGIILSYEPASATVTEVLVGGDRVTDADLFDTIKVDVLEFVFAGGRGTVVRTVDGGTTLIVETVTDEPLLRAAYFSTMTMGTVAGDSGFFRVDDDGLPIRFFPDLLALPSGRVILACNNVTRQTIEILISDDGGRSFRRVDLQASGTVLSANEVPPSLTIDDLGVVYCTIGDSQGGICSLDEGETWIPRKSPSLPLPLGVHPAGDTLHNPAHRRVIYYEGRLIATMTKGESDPAANHFEIDTYVSRDWLTTSTLYKPAIPGVEHWLGHDNAKAVFSGEPQIDDQWTSEPRYDYPRSHLLIDSPSIFTRTSDVSQAFSYLWDAQDLTDASHFELTGLALFGTNFRRALLRISINSWNSATFPTVTDYVEFELTADVSQTQQITDSFGARIEVEGLEEWERDEFAPGNRTYWAIVHSGAEGQNVTGIFQILANSATTLLVERTATGSLAGQYLTIITDRMVTLGTSGDLNGSPIADLRASGHRYTRLVQIIIPQHSIVDGEMNAFADAYAKIGTAVLGVHDLATAPTAAEKTARVPYLIGFDWQPVANQITQTAQSGVSSTRHFGKPGQRWRLPEIAEPYQRDQILRSLRSRLMQPFCLVFQGNYPTKTAELVKLVEEPISTHVVRDWSRRALQLVEVV